MEGRVGTLARRSALAVKPVDRYASAREMLNDIEHFHAQSQWTSSSREIVQVMQAVLPPPDPHRYEPLPGVPLPPDIEGEDQDGQRFKLSDYRGKVVLLDIWYHL